MSITLASPLPAGATFVNGVDGLHSVSFNWAERLTVSRLDTRSYGVTRYVVTDRHGRHGHAY